jgi:antitoxin component HigA of HigAB toxin-antitoxin module
LRKLREEVAREYEEKYRASLEEVDKYKDQLEQGLKDAERRQNAIV